MGVTYIYVMGKKRKIYFNNDVYYYKTFIVSKLTALVTKFIGLAHGPLKVWGKHCSLKLISCQLSWVQVVVYAHDNKKEVGEERKGCSV